MWGTAEVGMAIGSGERCDENGTTEGSHQRPREQELSCTEKR